MSIPGSAATPPPTVVAYPAGLVNLFLTEMWERFSFYGMRAILLLFLIAPAGQGGLGLTTMTATTVFALYNAVVYLLALPGGWIADRLTGTRKAVLFGGVIVATGHWILALPSHATLYLGLLLVAAGTGLLRPNISTMVGELYDRLPGSTPARRDSGFSVYYLAVNAGAWGGAIATGLIGRALGWHAGFAVAAAGMTIALVQYVVAGRSLGDTGRDVHRPIDEYRRRLLTRRAAGASLMVAIAVIIVSAAITLLTDASPIDAVLLTLPPVIVAVPVAYFSNMLGDFTLTPEERSRIHAYVPIFCGAALFWLIYNQAGNLLNLFADGKTDRGFQLPASWLQSVNPMLILLLAPAFALLWHRLGERAPGTPVKFALGLIGIGASFVLMGFAGSAAQGGHISPIWLVGIYLIQTVSELLVAPVGLSVTTQLAPTRFASQMMGLWFLAVAAGDAVGGYVIRLNSVVGDTVYYGLLGLVGVAAGLAFWLGSGRIRLLMAGVT